MPTADRVTVVIASYLEAEHIERIRSVDQRLEVIYRPDLLPQPRYPADHTAPLRRSAEQESEWRRLLARAEVLFDFDHTNLDALPELAPQVRWIQATSAGIGQLVSKRGLDRRMPRTTFTTASGVHAQPLAEFCLMSMLYFIKQMPLMLENQRQRRWQRYATSDLAERTLAILGVGRIGREVARMAQALNMTVIGAKRRPREDPASLFLDELYGVEQLDHLLRRAEFLVIITPHTPETEGMIGARELELLPQGAVLINIGRGAVVDEPALIEALRSGRLGGAALDVFAEEPLPSESPLWEMANVLVSPHSSSTSDRENRRITDLFCENLRRYLAGEALVNVLDVERLY